MTIKVDEEFSDWETYYKNNEVTKMPWYDKNLDHDLENEIKTRNVSSGRFLDLGTGPGTQAIQLAKQGFDVTATDLSENAILKAKNLSNEVNFVKDDFMNSKLQDNEFNFIFDRGCFHVFDIPQRATYVEQIKRILNKNGILFLKCMSIDEKDLPADKGPHRLSKQEIHDVFSNDFEIETIRDTFFTGTINPLPKALFAVLKKKPN
jgi:ubiquinone/menaquinone biosynthesis C-methylase UbiE